LELLLKLRVDPPEYDDDADADADADDSLGDKTCGRDCRSFKVVVPAAGAVYEASSSRNTCTRNAKSSTSRHTTSEWPSVLLCCGISCTTSMPHLRTYEGFNPT